MRPPLNCVVYKQRKIISNRTWIKCFFNPLFRFFGYQLASLYENDTVVKNHVLMKLDKCYKNIFHQWYVSLIEDWGEITWVCNEIDSCNRCEQSKNLICRNCKYIGKG